MTRCVGAISRLSNIDNLILCFHTFESMKSSRSSLKTVHMHAGAFKALGHAGRLKTFLLVARGGGSRSLGEIQAALRLPAPTLSHHVDQLRRAGLVVTHKRERFVYCEVASPLVGELARLLATCV
jgi:DNA-binding transcriptional ArsR family regulator